MTKGTVNDLLSCVAEALVAKPIHLFIIRHGGIGSGSFHSRRPVKNIDMILLQQRDDRPSFVSIDLFFSMRALKPMATTSSVDTKSS